MLTLLVYVVSAVVLTGATGLGLVVVALFADEIVKLGRSALRRGSR